MFFHQSILLLISISHVALALAPVRRATVCNGHAELCDKGYGTVAFIGSHDSYAIANNTNNPAANQDQPIPTQLNDGIRMLQVQAHNEKNVIKLCHTSCGLYDGGTFEAYLKIVKTWLDANPNEVLSLLIVNIDNIPVTSYDPIFKAAGLDTIAFIPPSTPLPRTEWPTLGSMIDSGRRFVIFIDNGATAEVPYIIDEFSNIWETAFNVIDPNFDCKVNRTKGDPPTQFILINHFLDRLLFNQPVPDIASLPQTNAATGPGSVGAQVDVCVADHGRTPNFILVDYYEHADGGVFQAAATINGVPYNPPTPIAKPPTSRTGTASGTATSGQVSVTSKPLGYGQAVVASVPLVSLIFVISMVFGPLILW